MKVLHLLSSNKYSGAENVVTTIINNFKAEIDMVYCSPNGEISKILMNKDIPYIPLQQWSRKQLKKILKIYQPDIIHAHDYRASTLAAISGFNGTIISHLHSNTLFAKSWNLKTILYSLTLSRYKTVVGVSDAVYKESVFRKQMKEKFVTLYNFVDLNEVIEKSEQYKWDKEYDLFFFGRLTEQKDPFKFINIVKEIKLRNPAIKAVMIGDGEKNQECKNYINQLYLNDVIDMLGFVENPFPIIKKCKIQIMPSKYEGFGLVAIESIILNKPVINSGVGGLGEIFKKYPELICNTEQQYVETTMNLMNQRSLCVKNIANPYTNKQLWLEQLRKIYEIKRR